MAFRDDARRLEQRNTVTTYLAHYDGELVGYISPMVDAVVLETKEQMLMRFAVARGYEIADAAGCRLLTLDAYPDAISFYERLGFLRNKAKPYREREHPSMRFDLFAPDALDWL